MGAALKNTMKNQTFFRFLLFSAAAHALIAFMLPEGSNSVDMGGPTPAHLLRMSLTSSPKHIVLNEDLLPPAQKKRENMLTEDSQKNHEITDIKKDRPANSVRPDKRALTSKQKRQPTINTPQRTEPDIAQLDNRNSENAVRLPVKHQRIANAIEPSVYPSPVEIQQIQKIISAKLHPHFVYPKLAQIKNWEGTVLLTMNLLGDGRINNVKLYKSSGYSILDRSALQTIKKATAFTEALKLSGGVMVELQLPIIFTLQEG